jgi:hypothetical protein
MYKYYISVILLLLGSTSLCIASEGTAGITGQYTGEYRITMLGCPGVCSASSYITLGTGIKDVSWVWDFDDGVARIEGTTLSVGFDYEIQDIGNVDPDENIVYFTDNGDGTYTLEHGFQIYNPNVGSPRKETSTTFTIIQTGNELIIDTIDIEIDGSQDGVLGTQITDVFPMTIAPVMTGWARIDGSDSTGSGISDTDKMALGLNPNILDTDGDAINDIEELGGDFNNPLDSDNDSVIDALEFGDNANNSQKAAGFPLLGGVAGLATTADILSGETVTIQVEEHWRLTEVLSDLMVVDTDTATSTEETEFVDSTLGEPGLDYVFGQVSVSALASSHEENITLQLQYSSILPTNNLLLVYTLELQDDGSEKFTLLPSSQWNRLDDNTLEIIISIAEKRNLTMKTDKVKVVVAPVANSLGAIERDQSEGAGGIAWNGLILLVFMLLLKPKWINIKC